MDERVPILSHTHTESQSSHLPYEQDRISHSSSGDDEEDLHSPTSSRIKDLLPKLFYGFFGMLLCGSLSQSCLLLKTVQESNIPMIVLSSVSLVSYVLLCLMLIYVASGKLFSFMEVPRTYLILSIVNWILLLLVILNIVMFIFMV
uniref:Uncharacterized protein n=1 Tax=Lepeophtheirus salmonis TaxID=72036 RepID=A0A0K2T6Q4_LEPSM